MEKINGADINKVVSSLRVERPRYKYFLIMAAVVLVALTVYGIWFKYFSPQAQAVKDWQKYAAWEKQYKDRLAADKYGGQTPQETLNLFTDALRKGDVDLASKYFVLNADGSVKPEVISGLKILQNNGGLTNAVNLLEKMRYDGKNSDANYATFYAEGADGNTQAIANLKFNSFSKVWKIESF